MARAPETDTTSDVRADGAAASPCLACGAPVPGKYCPHCGYERARPAPPVPPWPGVGDGVDADGQHIEIRAPLFGESHAWRYLADDAEGHRFEVLVVRRGDPDGVLAARADARAALGDLALPPTFELRTDDALVQVTRLPDAPSVAEGLTEVLADPASTDAVTLVHRWALPLARRFAALHQSGRFLGGADPGEVLVDDEGRCYLRQPQRPFELIDGPRPPGRRRAVRGYAAPEVHGRCGGVDARADVFFVGAALYYALARVAPFAEAGGVEDRLPAPHLFHEDVPPELAAVARRATSPLPTRRYADAGALLEALDVALDSVAARRAAGRRVLSLDVGHELHIGVLKGQYSPQNQDDLFLAYHADSAVGLFVVSDGVSISEYGTGDIASGCVRDEALELWQGIVHGRFVDGDGGERGDALDLDETLDGRPLDPSPRLPEAEAARQGMLRGMMDAANARIGELVRAEYPRFPGPPEGIMAATAVTALLDANRVTLASIGDSRIYLLRDGHISSLMVDHNLATQLIRMGRPPTVARGVPAANALIRCVGEFEKDAEGALVPVPLQPDVRTLTVLPGDTLVLCSDGIPDYAGFDEEDAEARILEAVRQAPGAPWAAFELMVLANRGGGGDNISCIVLRFDAPEAD